MATTIHWHGHATFLVETGGHRILIDPFFDENPAATAAASDVTADTIIVSHGHEDHIADAVSIAQRTGATVIANFEIATWLGKQGVENTHPMHIGGAHRFEFGTVKLTIAHHGSGLPDGSYGGNPCGILLTLPDATIYFAADTGLFGDMRLIGEEGIDLAVLPIGDNFTMGPDDALRAIRLIEAKSVIPCHYNTWPLIEQDAEAWARRVTAETDAEPIVLKPGESHTLGE